MFQRVYGLLIFLFVGLTSLVSSAEELVKLSTRDGITQSFLLSTVEQPQGSLVLFAGGHGRIELHNDGRIRWGKNNFLVRSRDYFTAAGFNVAVLDAPSDHYGKAGMKGGFRASEEHAMDVSVVVEYLRRQAWGPVWLVGTSRGTESAASVALRRPGLVDGIVLTASISEENDKGISLPEMPLNKIRTPVFIATHAEDACWLTPPSGSERLRQALVNAEPLLLKIYNGGYPPESNACKALSAHGFYGVEESVTGDIISFIQTSQSRFTQRDNDPRHE